MQDLSSAVCRFEIHVDCAMDQRYEVFGIIHIHTQPSLWIFLSFGGDCFGLRGSHPENLFDHLIHLRVITSVQITGLRQLTDGNYNSSIAIEVAYFEQNVVANCTNVFQQKYFIAFAVYVESVVADFALKQRATVDEVIVEPSVSQGGSV